MYTNGEVGKCELEVRRCTVVEDYRVAYEITDEERVVQVMRVRHRAKAYL